MPEKPPEYISKKSNKNGELIEVDFEKKIITSRSRAIEDLKMTPEEEQKMLMDIEKYRIDFFRWLDGHILKMKYKYEEINKLLTAGGYSHVFQYESYKHLKNDPGSVLDEEFEKIMTHEMLFGLYLKEFFNLKEVLESALKSNLTENRGRRGADQLAKKLQAYLGDLKINYEDLKNQDESQIIKKLEEFAEKNKKMTAN